ncbi:MAG: glycerophosphodiester phosphodiesterase [Oceanococcus sp.]
MSTSNSSDKQRLPRIIGHRGASWARPENTAAAFDLALQEGADGLELDLQLTRDGHAVVFHDKTLSMLGMKHRRIEQYTRAELRQLDVGSWFSAEQAGARILDLDEVLSRYGEVTDLYLEIKPVGELRKPEAASKLAHVVADRVAAHSHLNRIYVLSFSDAVLQQVADSHAHLRCVRNLSSPDELAGMSAERLQDLYAICVNIRRFSIDDVQRVHAANKRLFAYTVDSPKQLKVALQLQVDAVISNMPERARKRLNALL